ncbi:MAG: acyl-CoA dehydrogenase [Microbacteriaceae bacterium]
MTAPDTLTQVSESVAAGGAPAIDVEALGRQLLGTWAEARLTSRTLVSNPDMHKIPGQPIDEHRARVLEQLKILAAHGQVRRSFPTRLGGMDDHGGNIAAFEELVFGDPSSQIKSGVQWGLFGAAVLHLGTEKHHEKWLPGIMTLEIPGIYAMTETGHGSDVASIGTTATYDPATEEFVINTPFKAAWKDYLGNAALHGQHAVVFAQLITNGMNHGVHAFYVPVRNGSEMLPGVQFEDDGMKGGLVGIDNGRLAFDHVRVPRENLLNRYGDVAADGTYSSPIKSPGRRFFTMLGTLVQGRVSLDGAAVNASALAMLIAVKYGNERRQFNGADGEEVVLLDYQRHQRRLLPRLATVYAQRFAHEEFLIMFDEVFSGKNDSDEHREDLETLAAALKPLSTWAALDILQEAREACGGQGFLSENRLTGLRADLDIYVTFEGDNNVLLQLVAKRLLTDFAKKFKGADAATLAKYALGQGVEKAMTGSGLRRLGQNIADLGSTARSVNELRDPATQHALLADRVETMVAEVAGRLNEARKQGPKAAAEAFNQNQNELIEAGRAHGELLQWEAFTRALQSAPDAGTAQVLTWLRDLFAFGLLEQHLAWYLMNGRMSPQRAQAVGAYIDRLVERLRPYANDLVDAFGLTPELIRAPIVWDEAPRQAEAREYYAAEAAAGRTPKPEPKK